MAFVYKYFTILLVFYSLLGCDNKMSHTIDCQTIKGIWEKDGVYLLFKNENEWKLLAASNNGCGAPLFSGDEKYAFPDGFASFDEYNYSKYVPEFCFECNKGSFLLNTNLTLFENKTSHIIIYEIYNSKLTIKNDVLLHISFDDNLYRPFNPKIREAYNNKKKFNLRGTWRQCTVPDTEIQRTR